MDLRGGGTGRRGRAALSLDVRQIGLCYSSSSSSPSPPSPFLPRLRGQWGGGGSARGGRQFGGDDAMLGAVTAVGNVHS